MNNDNNKLINALIIMLVTMMIFTGFTSYQSQVEFNELSSKIDELEGKKEISIADGTKPETIEKVGNKEYLIGIEKIVINEQEPINTLKEVEKIDNIFSEEVVNVKHTGDWELGKLYTTVTKDNKTYTVKTYKNEIYGITDDETKVEKIIREEEKISEVININEVSFENDGVVIDKYTEYAVRFENPDIEERLKETVPHIVGYIIFEDAADNNKFYQKLDMVMEQKGYKECYVYNDVQDLEADLNAGLLDIDSEKEKAPNSIIHYTDNSVYGE